MATVITCTIIKHFQQAPVCHGNIKREKVRTKYDWHLFFGYI